MGTNNNGGGVAALTNQTRRSQQLIGTLSSTNSMKQPG
jgi:hypothetical protein